MTGRTKKRIRKYLGKIPKSGKSNFTFGGINLHLRQVKAETLLVHIDTKAVVSAYPYGTKMEVILESIARNHQLITDFHREPTAYELYEPDENVGKKKKTSSHGDTVGITMDSYSDGSCVVPRQTIKPKKVYDLNKKEEW